MNKEIKVVRMLLPLFRFYPWGIPIIVTLGLMSSFAEGIGIGLFIPFLQGLTQVADHSHSGNWFIDSLFQLFNTISPDRRLLVIAFCIFGSVLVKASLFFGNKLLFGRLNANISHRLRSGIFEQLLKVSYRFIEKSQSGRLLNALASETWRTSDALSILVNSIISLCALMVYVILLLLISWKLTLIVSGVMLLFSFIVKAFTSHVESIGKKVTLTNTDMASRMIEGVEGMNVIRAFGRESYEKDRFDDTSDRLRRAFIKLGIVAEAVNPSYQILAAALLVLILLSTINTPGNLPATLVFIFVLYRLQPKIIELDGARVRLISLKPSIDEVLGLLSSADKDYLRSGMIPYESLKSGIFFDNVTFRYDPSERPALQDVSVHIPAGKTTALVGPSGGGKSTLIKLILRFYDTREGHIMVDSNALPSLDLASWRDRIALVSQDAYIFNASIRDNIAYGRLDATEEDIIAAAKKAHAHEFIKKLPQGYDTKVGDRGIRLSGGQQQRITLARAIVRDPEILILDEATSELDYISENVIQEALNTLGLNRTVIIIAHRLSTVERADRIVVLEEGRVREQGDLKHLLKIDGLFAKLYTMQFQRALN